MSFVEMKHNFPHYKWGDKLAVGLVKFRAFKIILTQKLYKNSQQNQIKSGELVLKPWEKGETME